MIFTVKHNQPVAPKDKVVLLIVKTTLSLNRRTTVLEFQNSQLRPQYKLCDSQRLLHYAAVV